MNITLESLPKMDKKAVKNYVNENGFFTSADIQKETNAPDKYKGTIPEGAIYFKAIASTGELNRNGYIIRESAWPEAIAGYMENPVLLLQHDIDQPIGQVLSASLQGKGLVIEGFAYDDLTDGRLGRGLLNAISTGHITKAREFVNTVTKEVLSEEEFARLSWDERVKDEWIMAVTVLEWLENSIVSIGANRKSLISSRDIMKNYISTMKNEVDEPAEQVEDPKPAEVVAPAEDPVTPEAPEVVEEPTVTAPEEAPTVQEDPEKTNEQPKTDPETKGDEIVPDETLAANSVKAGNAVIEKDSNTVQVDLSDWNQAKTMLDDFAKLAVAQDATIESQKEKITTLETALASIPVRKGFVVTSTLKQEAAKPGQSQLGKLLIANGIGKQ